MTARCNDCADKGLIRVRYDESEGFDLAVCSCPAGAFWNRPDVVRAWCAEKGVAPVQIGRLEEFLT